MPWAMFYQITRNWPRKRLKWSWGQLILYGTANGKYVYYCIVMRLRNTDQTNFDKYCNWSSGYTYSLTQPNYLLYWVERSFLFDLMQKKQKWTGTQSFSWKIWLIVNAIHYSIKFLKVMTLLEKFCGCLCGAGAGLARRTSLGRWCYHYGQWTFMTRPQRVINYNQSVLIVTYPL